MASDIKKIKRKNEQQQQKTQVCTKCGRKLPIDMFYMDISGKRKRRCKDCYNTDGKRYRENTKNEKALEEQGINKFKIERKYKNIYDGRILDVGNLELVAEDEIFVTVMDCPYLYISNYGRGIECKGGKTELLQKKNNMIAAEKVVRADDEKYNWQLKVVEFPVDALVVQEFVVNPDCVRNTYIWHMMNDEDDCYYKNLYPLNEKQFAEVQRIFCENGSITEDEIVAVMNDRKFLPDWITNKIMVPNVCGVGYAGCPETKFNTKVYKRWNNMISRCYNELVQQEKPSYIGCSVCEEWYSFNNYRKWYEDHEYQIKTNVMCVDKDILFKGNTEYSPSTCVIVPNYVNTTVLVEEGNRSELPVGVSYNVSNSKYFVSFSRKRVHQYVDTAEEAFEIYRKLKKEKMEYYADKLAGLMPETVCDALRRWEVEITD